MSDPYIGEIRMFGGPFAPQGWAECNGETLKISENETLFSLIGTTYGGDGSSTFGVPDLRGRLPVHNGSGPGITQSYAIGESGGLERVTLTGQQLPSHGHLMMASTGPGVSAEPTGNVVGSPPAVNLFQREAPDRPLAASMVLPAGASQPHENQMPFVAIRYIIALEGAYPSQE